ncbi:MAG TPA: c-type cytochrome biogenesis protein CcsB [Jatrophihabitans sp.]|jgi:cytochrome c-type biogenesis protein CcsB
MAINTGLAQLSEGLWTAATGTYMLAVVGYTGEYAFGRRGKVNSIAEKHAVADDVVRERSLVGAGATGSSAATPAADKPAADKAAADKPGWNVGAGVVQTRTARSEWWGRAAIALTILGGAFHLASVAIRGIAVDRVPWGNMYEFTLVVGLIATLAWLATLVRLPQLRYLGLFVMLPVLVVMFLAGTLYTKASKLVPALQSYWLAIHVSSVATATGILMTSSALTILFLVRSRYERLGAASGRRLSELGSRLPAAATLDKAAYRAAAFAFPIYTAGVIFGAIWAEAAWGRYWGWDPKETWAFIAWVLYAMYLHARATAGWKGNRAAFINLLGFGAMIFNFFVVNLVISGLHSYAGLN